jgi:hypothetical protein
MPSKPVTPAAYKRQIQWLLFAVTFVAFAYFHQGGGWNQNGRFAMVRAMVEEGKFWIDSYLIYGSAKTAKGADLVRVPIRDCEFQFEGKSYTFWWADAYGRPAPINKSLDGVVLGVNTAAKELDVQVGTDAKITFSVANDTAITKNGAPAKLGSLAVKDFVRIDFGTDAKARIVASRIAASEKGTARDLTFVELGQVACTGDVAFDRGHFHPNKAPGTSFIAVPAYFVIYHFERLFGISPDEWWTLTRNAWLTSVFSVGLLSALGCVVFYRLALKLSGGRTLASLLTALTFAFGTMFLPFATMLFEHNIIAVALVASFYFLYRVRETLRGESGADALSDNKSRLYLFLAGLCAGYAAITNYIIAVVVVMLGCYLLFGVRKKLGWLWFGLGVLGPLLLICAYNQICFGTPFTTNYRHQNPLFVTGAKAFLDVFIIPQWDVLLAVLVSPYRGLFFSAPVLVMGVAGLVWLFCDKKFRAEAWLLFSILAFFLLFIISYNGWHGGWCTTPRYLGPALPFLAVTMVFGFTRLLKTTCVLAVISVAVSFLTTAVDPQPPIGNAGHAVVLEVDDWQRVQARPQWKYNPLTEYEWPLFAEGRAWPLLRAQRDVVAQFYDRKMQQNGQPPEVRAAQIVQLENKIDDQIRAGEPAMLLLAPGRDGQLGVALSELSTYEGPVSVNPMGIYEGWTYRVFQPHSSYAYWNSFNVGEFLFERSRWSLAPLLLAGGALVVIAIRMAGKVENAVVTPPKRTKAAVRS